MDIFWNFGVLFFGDVRFDRSKIADIFLGPLRPADRWALLVDATPHWPRDFEVPSPLSDGHARKQWMGLCGPEKAEFLFRVASRLAPWSGFDGAT